MRQEERKRDTYKCNEQGEQLEKDDFFTMLILIFFLSSILLCFPHLRMKGTDRK